MGGRRLSLGTPVCVITKSSGLLAMLLLAAGGLAASSCQSSTPKAVAQLTQQQAIKLVVLASGLTRSAGVNNSLSAQPSPAFPDSNGVALCTIVRYPGDYLAPPIQIPAVCATAAQPDPQGGWTITFTEYWDATRFHVASDSSGGVLQYSWVFGVAANSRVRFVGRQGNEPPQLAESF
jgi:hypothetical protein